MHPACARTCACAQTLNRCVDTSARHRCTACARCLAISEHADGELRGDDLKEPFKAASEPFATLQIDRAPRHSPSACSENKTAAQKCAQICVHTSVCKHAYRQVCERVSRSVQHRHVRQCMCGHVNRHVCRHLCRHVCAKRCAETLGAISTCRP